MTSRLTYDTIWASGLEIAVRRSSQVHGEQ